MLIVLSSYYVTFGENSLNIFQVVNLHASLNVPSQHETIVIMHDYYFVSPACKLT